MGNVNKYWPMLVKVPKKFFKKNVRKNQKKTPNDIIKLKKWDKIVKKKKYIYIYILLSNALC